MDVTRFIIVCAVNLQLIMTALAAPPAKCAQLGCGGKGRKLPEEEVIERKFHLEAECGELLWQGAYVNCKNIRIKSHYQCSKCQIFFRQNKSPPKDNPSRTCASHFNKEIVHEQ
jgi:hypothetical protein